jgi:hypothetical protein
MFQDFAIRHPAPLPVHGVSDFRIASANKSLSMLRHSTTPDKLNRGDHCPAGWITMLVRVSEGMQGAEEDARRAGVYPGTRRDIRKKYAMDWSGWDR